VAQFVQHLEGTSDNPMGLLLQQEARALAFSQVGLLICVHLRPSVVSLLAENKNASHGGCEAWAFIPDWRDERYGVAVVARFKITEAR